MNNILINFSRNTHLEPLCLTPECISLAADTYNAMDLTVDPCEVSEN